MNTNRRGFLGALLAMAAAPKAAASLIAPNQQDVLIAKLKGLGIDADTKEFTLEAWIQVPERGSTLSRRMPGKIIPGKWHYIATVIKEGKTQHYIDGIAIEADSLTDSAFAELHLLALGARSVDAMTASAIDSYRVTTVARKIQPSDA